MAKTSKKTTARRSVKKGRAQGVRYADNARIQVLIKENPAREDTLRHERIALMMKHKGKTVGEFVKHDGLTSSLHFAEKQGWIKIAG